MDQEKDHSEKKLYLPLHCIIPLEARQDKELPAEAKIFLGELHVLANKYGYVFASNEQLAEMKECDVSTIKRWISALEKNGHIWRDTKSELCRDEEGECQWKRKRKIYIGSQMEVTQRKDYEELKNEPFPEELKNEPFHERCKNEPYKYRNRNTECRSTEQKDCSSKIDDFCERYDAFPDKEHFVKKALEVRGCDKNFINEMIQRFPADRIFNGLFYTIQQAQRKTIKKFYGYLRRAIEHGRVWSNTKC